MIYHFAHCSIDFERRVFLRADEPVHLEPQVFDLICALVEKQGRLVAKDELVDSVWHGLSISDATISARINAARKAVGDTGRSQAVIKTVHGRGFRLVPQITEVAHMESAAPNSALTGSQNIRFAQAADGTKIASTHSGDGPPLIRAAHWLSHLELDWQSPVWQPLLDRLGKHNTLYCYDQRGTGLSTHGLENANLDEFVDDLKTVADANGLKRFPIFAASQAVPIAVRFAYLYPERVSGLILYGGYAEGRSLRAPSRGDIDEATILGLIRAGWGNVESPFVKAFASLFIPDATDAQMHSLVEMQHETISPDDAARLRQIIDGFNVRPILPETMAPTLVIHANSDAVQPVEQGRILASEIPNAQYVSLKSRNHIPLPQEESWEKMMKDVQTFLADLGE